MVYCFYNFFFLYIGKFLFLNTLCMLSSLHSFFVMCSTFPVVCVSLLFVCFPPWICLSPGVIQLGFLFVSPVFSYILFYHFLWSFILHVLSCFSRQAFFGLCFICFIICCVCNYRVSHLLVLFTFSLGCGIFSFNLIIVKS